MTQRQLTEFIAAGSVPPCSRCHKLPKHFEDCRGVSAGGGHIFECHPCDNRTGKHATPTLANADWCQRNGYAPRDVDGSRVRRIGERGRS